MSEFGDFDADSFLAYSQELEQGKTDLGKRVQSYVERLNATGVVIPSAVGDIDFDSELDNRIEQAISYGTVLTEEVHGQIVDEVRSYIKKHRDEALYGFTCRSTLISVSTLKATYEVLEARGVSYSLDEASEQKKKVQAQIWAYGLGAPWIELVDQELPGEGLFPDDYDTLAAHLVEDDKNQTEITDQARVLLDEMQKSLGDELEAPATKHLVKIMAICLLDRRLDNTEADPSVNSAEAARLYLIEHKLTSPRWMALIDHYFDS